MKYIEDSDLKGGAVQRHAKWHKRKEKAGQKKQMWLGVALLSVLPSMGLAVGGWILYPTVDFGAAMIWLLPRTAALAGGLGLLVALGLGVGGASVGRRALSGLVAAAVLVPALFGLMLGINRWLDPEPSAEQVVPVLDVTSRTSSKGPTRHFAEIRSWRVGENSRKLPITQWDHNVMRKGLHPVSGDVPKKKYKIRMVVGRGFFGLEYVESLSVLKPPEMKTKRRQSR